jgi:hypothetical protein
VLLQRALLVLIVAFATLSHHRSVAASEVELAFDGAGELLADRSSALATAKVGDTLRVRLYPGLRLRLAGRAHAPDEVPDPLAPPPNDQPLILWPPNGVEKFGVPRGPLTVLVLLRSDADEAGCALKGATGTVSEALVERLSRDEARNVLNREPPSFRSGADTFVSTLARATLSVPEGFAGDLTCTLAGLTTTRAIEERMTRHQAVLDGAGGTRTVELSFEPDGSQLIAFEPFAQAGDYSLDLYRVIGAGRLRLAHVVATVNERYSAVRFQALAAVTQQSPHGKGRRALATFGAAVVWNPNYTWSGEACDELRCLRYVIPGVTLALAGVPDEAGETVVNALFGVNFALGPALTLMSGFRFQVDSPAHFVIGRNIWAGMGIDVVIVADLVSGKKNVASVLTF